MNSRNHARKHGRSHGFLRANPYLVGLTVVIALGVMSLALSTQTAATQELDKKMPSLSGDAAVEFLKSRSEYDSLSSAFEAAVDDTSNSPSTTTRITASDGTIGNLFGNSVAISGDTAIIGAPDDRPLPQFLGPGAAYIFVRNGTGWTQQQKLTHVNPNCNCDFGISVGVSGDTVIVGSRGLPTFGLAFVYVRSETTWSLQQTLSPPSGNSNEPRFGFSVAISGETVLVAAHTESTSGSRSGAAYIFVRSGGSWSQQQRLTASDATFETQFGNTVAIDGEQAIIGAMCGGFVSGSCRPGAAYIFVRNDSNWTQQQKLTSSDGAVGDQFGSSVALSGNTVLVGAQHDDIGSNSNQGSAYVFTRNGTTWTQEQKLTAPDGAAGDVFGSSAGLDGGIFVVGARNDGIGANLGQGSAYVYNRCDPPGAPPVKLTATNPAGTDQFGTSLAVNSAIILVGAIAGVQVGSAYVIPRTDIAFRGGAQCEVEIEVNITSDLADADVEDDVCDVDTGQSGQQCSLRAAIQTANAKDGPDEIKFDIPGGGPHSISPLTQLPSLTETVMIDATTQPGYTTSPLIELVGTSTTGGLGFAAGSANSTVKGLAINRFAVAIGLSSSGNRVEKCYIGLSPNGTAAGTPGEQQIGIDIKTAAASNNTIGGAGDLGNVISNNGLGVGISQGATGNNIIGNRIGTNPAGTTAIPNTAGVGIDSANGNTIGGPMAALGNLISGNEQVGVGLLTNASNNRIGQNLIGTKANGTEKLGNEGAGVLVQNGANGNFIENNVIGGHDMSEFAAGIVFLDTAGAENSVTGNSIGVDRNGITAIPNTYGIITSADSQIIGSQAGPNTIGFNLESGIWITSISGGSNPVVNNNLVHYNFVGTNGTDDIGNAKLGIWVNGQAQINTVTRNIVSGNAAFGIVLADGASTNNISLNFVGTNTSGTTAIPNGGGIWIRQATDNNLESNLVSGNSIGILVGTNIGFGETITSVESYKQHAKMQSSGGTFTTGNRLFGNVVGLNAGRSAAIPGCSIGIAIGENARNNFIGTPTGSYNFIAGNTATIGYGIFLGTLNANPTEDSLPQFNTFQRNLVGLGGDLQSTISNNIGFVLLQAARNTAGGDTDALANIIVASTLEGISIRDNTRENTFLRNFLGVLPPGFGSRPGQTSPLSPSGGTYGNGSHGILLENGAQGNALGGSTSSTGLVIANNGGNGINLAPTAGNGNRIGTNSIYGNTLPGIDIGGNGSTPNDPGDADTGPNNLQNYPQLITRRFVNDELIIDFNIDSAPANSAYGTNGIYVEFFKADLTGEGERFIGSTFYTLADYQNSSPGMKTVNLGNINTLGITAADNITATATDANGNTSEFYNIFAPTAALVSVSGRVTTSGGQGIRNVSVSLTDSEGDVRRAVTNSFGKYRFDDVEAGQTVILGVASKRYAFTNPTRVLMVVDDIADADFVADDY